MSDSTLRIESKFKNARLFHAIAEASLPITGDYNKTWSRDGGGKVSAFCTLHGLPYQLVLRLLNLRTGPLKKPSPFAGNQSLRPRAVCLRLAEILHADVTWLFPADLYDVTWPTVLVREIDASQFRSLAAARSMPALGPLPDEQLHVTETAERLRQSLRQSLQTLTPREAQVLTLRFGLDGGEAHTFEALTNVMGVTRERVRQIECKAFRKMRHPRRSRQLREYL